MAKKKTTKQQIENLPDAPAREQPIIDTIETNYMPYAMSVIISRAIPEIDGFKPAHRKLLYTMYKMGLMSGPRTKSANVVGATMSLNPHGDAAIYETLVRLTRGNESLLHPFIDSKGSFGKQYSAEMAYSAARYTEVRLEPFCAELFRGIEKNAVEMVDNYDGTKKEPALLPTTFPNILVTPNNGIAVGMASRICPFNLAEICDGTIALLKNPNMDVDQMLDIVKAPDFPGGGNLIYDRKALSEVYKTGTGSVKVRARYVYDKQQNCIDVIQIPYSTNIEAIIKKITEMIKADKLKDVSDVRDEIDLSGFKLTIDLKKGTDPDKLMNKLFKTTPLEDSFSANFNVLIDSVPRTMGIIEILNEWIRFRLECVKRELSFDLDRKKDKLHLLLGLGKILLDIDKAIRIIRETKLEKEVVPNLMEGFNIDQIQAEYIAEIKLRHLNREYILSRIKEIEELQKQIAELEALIASEKSLKKYIINQLKEIKEKYGIARKTQIIYEHEVVEYVEEKKVENYPVRYVFSRQGYFKKITMLSLQRGSDEQAFKEGDSLLFEEDGNNTDELIFFSDKGKCYKAKADRFETGKSSALGDYVHAELGFDKGERCIYMINATGYSADVNLVFVFENGKAVKIPLSAYETKGPRKKLTGAYSTVSPIVAVFKETAPLDLILFSSDKKAIQISTSLIPQKTTKTAAGSIMMTLKKDAKVCFATCNISEYAGKKSYKKLKVPAAGVTVDGPMPNEDDEY